VFNDNKKNLHNVCTNAFSQLILCVYNTDVNAFYFKRFWDYMSGEFTLLWEVWRVPLLYAVE